MKPKWVARVNVVLISTYELGHQPFGVASPAAWLARAGASVTALDLAVEPFSEEPIVSADLIAFYVPMHTASRLATNVARRTLRLNPTAHVCFYGLYAPVNERFFRKLGADTILGGEFEEGLVSLYQRLNDGNGARSHQSEPVVSLAKQDFITPDRGVLPGLDKYGSVILPDGQQRVVGYTEATRGCKHLCRHCPIVPVYGGRFRAVRREVVLEDISQQVADGAEHITFGDPDFFNAIGHAIPLLRGLHERFPNITYDVTVKIEHLVKHADHLPTLTETGCLFVTSAVESVDQAILEYFDKRHTREDFMYVADLFRERELTLNPTFVTFTPWTTARGYLELLETIVELDLVSNVAPIQYAIRLLIPTGSKLLELAQVQELVEPFDEESLCYPWKHPDWRVDQLHRDVLARVAETSAEDSRLQTFAKVWALANEACATEAPDRLELLLARSCSARSSVPHLSEPWYCCAEPTEEQVRSSQS